MEVFCAGQDLIMEDITINVAKDFSRFPAGRYTRDGNNSGERFRDEYLVPAFEKPECKVTIDFDGTRGVASSFLEESFGGLVRKGFGAGDIQNRLQVKASDHSIALEIRKYIDEAAKRI